jgi:hypothetical protein
MREQYLKCGGSELEKALDVAGKKYAEEQETFEVEPLPEELVAFRVEDVAISDSDGLD